jgi:murein DD-endopeptidase MepM/ murein hydrolase activator NlpD
MTKRVLIIYFSFLLIVSCAHHRSGRYVYENGKWTFKTSKVGFMHEGIDFGRVDNTQYKFTDDSKFIWPVPSSKKVSSKFGQRRGRHHDGIDIPAVTGTHIVASATGNVIVSGWMRGYGKVIVIKHDDGYHTVYAHNSKHFVKKGQRVSQGEVIGKVGSTGRSTGPHLHFEIRRKNRVRNPAFYLARLKK